MATSSGENMCWKGCSHVAFQGLKFLKCLKMERSYNIMIMTPPSQVYYCLDFRQTGRSTSSLRLIKGTLPFLSSRHTNLIRTFSRQTLKQRKSDMKHIPTQCPLCSGHIQPGTTTFTVDLKTGVVVVRNVPAWVCTQCGEDWIEDAISEKLENIAKRARQQNTQLEMVSLAG